MEGKRAIGWIAAGLLILWTSVLGVSCDSQAKKSEMPVDSGPIENTLDPDFATKTAEAEMAAKTAQVKETATAQFRETADAIGSATAQFIATQTALAVKFETAEMKITKTALANRIASATARARPTDTPTFTVTPTQTNTPLLLPTSATVEPEVSQPSSDMIVRAPGEKSPGDHSVEVKNKTGDNVTIVMYGDLFNYTFYVPDGNYKIFLRPGFYTFTYYSCGGVSYGSGVFNSNWYWEFWCN